ncbi:hypothetical protein H257_17865 [Aphanomyces astaci]|uniref:Uncharacterized protein n=1 Tax=Aphanomyces astaci TaxID=112090 RepID=W4FET9_APHAT|nr:hypothetical protein H257_17865 [Aphanomyces astaci]ETV65404.1 hypothetical protein H257_17865 [Aphanomyces astaci]|eukprot:XP_009845119.1 hypothetical protein H257_17865 [Aphanomyces astaci]
MDESYIHQNYVRHNDSLYYPDDVHNKAPKPKHKGQPLCFVDDILDSGTDESKLLITQVWPYLKDNVGRQYTTDTAMEDVRAGSTWPSAS